MNKENGGGTSSRIDWVDVAKGMGLVLVLWGHLLYGGTWETVNRAIYSFHMPMYFILSGYLCHPHGDPYASFFKQKSYELLLPTVFFYFSLSLFMHFA